MGKYGPGDSLPSENKLVSMSGFARNTVRQALAELEKEGFLTKVKGKGTFVSEGFNKKEAPSARPLDLYGLVVPYIGDMTYAVLGKGFDDAACRSHQQMVICDTSNDVHKQGDVIFQLLDKGIGGLAVVTVVSGPTPPHQIRYLQEKGIPVVLCHRPVDNVSAPLVTWDAEKVGRMATEKILTLGHKKIVLHRFAPAKQHQSTATLWLSYDVGEIRRGRARTQHPAWGI